MPLTPTAKKYLAYLRKANAPLSTRDFAYHFKHDVARSSRTMRELSVDKLVEYFEKLDDDKINRRYFHLPGNPEVKQKEVKQKEVKQEVKQEVEEFVPKYTRLRDVYAEEDYEHNMSLVARSFFDFLEKDKKISVLLFREAAKPKEEFRKELREEGVEDTRDVETVEDAGEAVTELETKDKPKKEKVKISKTELRRQHIRDMLDTWFPAWAHIQSFPFVNPTAKLRSEKELLIVQQTGVL
jgi:hypothetical protein